MVLSRKIIVRQQTLQTTNEIFSKLKLLFFTFKGFIRSISLIYVNFNSVAHPTSVVNKVCQHYIPSCKNKMCDGQVKWYWRLNSLRFLEKNSQTEN